MEAPPGGWLNTKAVLGKADDLVRNNRLGKGLANTNTAISKKYGGAHGNKAPIDPEGGIDDKETDDWIAGKGAKDTKDPKPKAPAPTGAKTLDKAPNKDPKTIDDLKPGSAYNDGTATWTWTGTDWSDGAVKLEPATGFKQFKKAKNKFVKEGPFKGVGKALMKRKLNKQYKKSDLANFDKSGIDTKGKTPDEVRQAKSDYYHDNMDKADRAKKASDRLSRNKKVKEAPGAGIVKKVAGKVADKAVDFAANATGASRDDIKRAGAEQGGIIGKVTGLAKGDDNKQAQQVAQKATALKGVVGGKASGAQVAKGLDKISSGETLPPNIIKAIAPYATAIQSMMSNPQLFGKFKALMKQAEAGQNQQ